VLCTRFVMARELYHPLRMDARLSFRYLVLPWQGGVNTGPVRCDKSTSIPSPTAALAALASTAAPPRAPVAALRKLQGPANATPRRELHRLLALAECNRQLSELDVLILQAL
jgi:hypothetical protein